MSIQSHQGSLSIRGPLQPCHVRKVACESPVWLKLARHAPPQAGKRVQLSTEELFHQHFTDVYSGRWHDLWAAMQGSTQHVAFANPFTAACQTISQTQESNYPATTASMHCEKQGWLRLHRGLPIYVPPTALMLGPSNSTPTENTNKLDDAAVDSISGCKMLYFMDYASLLPALALSPQPGMRVLDMCAAPGGKSLVLAAQLFGALTAPVPSASCSCMDTEQGHAAGSPDASESLLVANDRSPARRSRLSSVLYSYLPAAVHHAARVTCHDAIKWHAHEAGCYHCILLDAPCSSERHLAQAGKVLSKDDWSPSRSKRNAETQYALLLSAAKVLAPGGRLVYSTCSIAPKENDLVVERLLNKFGNALGLQVSTADNWAHMQSSGQLLAAGSIQDVEACKDGRDIEAMPPQWASGLDQTSLGMHALPDKSGCGPLYWCVIQKAF